LRTAYSNGPVHRAGPLRVSIILQLATRSQSQRAVQSTNTHSLPVITVIISNTATPIVPECVKRSSGERATRPPDERLTHSGTIQLTISLYLTCTGARSPAVSQLRELFTDQLMLVRCLPRCCTSAAVSSSSRHRRLSRIPLPLAARRRR